MPFDVTMPDGTTISDVPDGTTKAQIQAKYAAHTAGPVPSKEDAIRAVPGGLLKGVAGIAGLPADLMRLGMGAVGIPTRQGPLPDSVTAAVPGGGAYGGGQELSDLTKPEGGYYEPKTPAGKYAQRAAEFLPALAGGEASLGARALGRVLAPAGGSFAGDLVDKEKHPYLSAALGTGGALLAGGGVGGVRAGVPALKSKLADLLLGKAGSANPKAVSLADKAKGLGIDIRPGQLSPSKFVNTADDQISRLPFTGYGESGSRVSNEAQNTQFTKALAKTIGVDANALTPDIISQAKKDIGAKFNQGLEGTTVKATPEFKESLGKVETEIADISPGLLKPDKQRLAAVLKAVSTGADGGLTGKQYQTMRQTGGLLDGLSNDANSSIANIGRSLRNTLDDAFQAQANPENAALIKDARKLYRNFKVVEPLADKAPLGNISPPLLLGQVNKGYQDLSQAGDIGDLGRIGQSFLKAPPNSGTAERSVITRLLSHPATLAAAGTAGALTAPLQAGAGLAGGALLARGLGKAINSDKALARLLTAPGATQISQNPKLMSQLLMMK